MNIYLKDDYGIPCVQYGLMGWKPKNPGTLYMYRGDSRVAPGTDYTDYSEEDYRRTIAHELGHILGLDDAYEEKRIKKEYDTLRGHWNIEE